MSWRRNCSTGDGPPRRGPPVRATPTVAENNATILALAPSLCCGTSCLETRCSIETSGLEWLSAKGGDLNPHGVATTGADRLAGASLQRRTWLIPAHHRAHPGRVFDLRVA